MPPMISRLRSQGLIPEIAEFLVAVGSFAECSILLVAIRI